MKKEHLDYLYEHRFALQARIDELVEKRKEPRDSSCAGCPDALDAELFSERNAIFIVNQIIENYIKLHPYTT